MGRDTASRIFLLFIFLCGAISASEPPNATISTSLSVFPLEIPPGSSGQFALAVNFSGESSLIFNSSVQIYSQNGSLADYISYPPSLIVGGESLRLQAEWQSKNLPSGAYLAVANISSNGAEIAIARRVFYIGVRLSNASELPPPEQWPGQQANSGSDACKDAQCSAPSDCQDGHTNSWCSYGQGCAAKGYFKVERCLDSQSLPGDAENSVCLGIPLLCAKSVGQESYAYICILPTLAVAAFAFAALLKSSKGRRKKRTRL